MGQTKEVVSMIQSTLDSFTAKPRPIRNKKGRRHHNPNGQSWCGPTALTVLTGKRYDMVEKDLLKHANQGGTMRLFGRGRGRMFRPSKKINQIKGMSNPSMRRALERYGYGMESKPKMYSYSQTFRQWIKATHGKRGKNWFLIVAGNHYMVVKGNRMWDTNTPAEGVSITKLPWKKRAKMESVWIVSRRKK